MMKKTIKDINVKGRYVFVRCDFNVPMKEGKITDDKRITGALPTIEYLIEKGAKIVLCSHMGRPKGKVNPEFSLKPVADRLRQLLGTDVLLANDVIGEDAKAKHDSLRDGQVMLLENVRFHKEEEENDPEFAKELAWFGEFYVNDAFGAAHRAHASTAGIADYLPAVAGFLMEKEVKYLGEAINNIERPYTAIMGGAKVSDKILLIENLLKKVDALIIGGGMAYTFIKALGGNIGTSLLEENMIDLAKDLLKKAEVEGVKVLLPVDTVATTEFSNDTPSQVVDVMKIPDNMMGLDIGPKTRQMFADQIGHSETVVWNGPMGVFEMSNYEAGTRAVAEAMAKCQGKTIIGGGDSAAAVNQFGLANEMLLVSTGGGASLEFLEGKVLPGVACLEDRERRPFIAGNWKMFKTIKEAEKFVEEFKAIYKKDEAEVGLIVPYLQLETVKRLTEGTGIRVGAQNMHFEDYGAFTGEISAPMLKEIGVDCCIIGHSERRQYFGDTDEAINKKLKKALKYGITPILCVGESLEQREAGLEYEVVEKQIKADFAWIPAEQAVNAVIAYEPIWAIGTGRTATAEQANEMCGAIRKVLAECYDESVASAIRIQYGGSVKPANASEILNQPEIDGALVGGASLKPEEFSQILKF
ncbi:MAG: triose-phosphate isomerase [Firmicutes bacterium]|nr:triose-phosphate isomerase [Bacillota bacterium]